MLQSFDSLLKDVIYCCVFFDLTGNNADETVEHLNQYIKFIYKENIIRLVLFVAFTSFSFFYFSVHNEWQEYLFAVLLYKCSGV